MGEVILEVKGLSCGYGSKKILSGINFLLNKGELAGIIGPNGSGKTTLLKTITGILKPWEGRVSLMNKDISGMTFRETANIIAVVSQHTDPATMTVEDYVLMGRMPHFGKMQFFESSADREIADRYIRLTGIEGLRKKYMTQISGGEKQLAFIARALAQEPALLLLDEPTSYLDITHQVGILDLIQRLNSELGITVVMIMHDLNLASEYCSRLILINEGSVHSDGTPHEVLTYKAIEEVYKTIVVVEKNPLSSKPFVLLVPEKNRKNQ